MRANILEALFSRAFQSHHGLLGSVDSSKYGVFTGFGLNVMTPLIQGSVHFPQYLRQRASTDLSRSSDPQIRHWVAFNSAKKQKIFACKKVPLFECDFDAALESALHKDKALFKSVKALFPKSVQHSSDPDAGTIDDRYIFAGKLSAPVGFVLDNFAISQENDLPLYSGDKESLSIPWPILGCGFSENDVLVWSYNLKGFSSITSHCFVRAASDSDTAYTEGHRSLIANSAIKILYLCGPRSESTIKAAVKELSRHTLELRGSKYPLYLEGSTSSPKRIYIRCPLLPSESWSLRVHESAKLSDAIRFGITMLKLKVIKPYFIESSSVIGHILCQARGEYLGKREPMTSDNLDDALILWLSRKGLQGKDDIKRIENIGGTMTRGLLMLLHALPRRPVDKGEKSSIMAYVRRSQRDRVYQKFDKESFNSMKEFVGHRVPQQNDFTQRLLSQSQDTAESFRTSGIEGFSQLEKDNFEQIGELQDLLVLRRDRMADPDQSVADEVDELSTYEAGVESLATLINNAKKSRFLNPKDPYLSISNNLGKRQERQGVVRRGQKTGKDRTVHGRRHWRDEAAVFNEKEYQYTVPLGVSYMRSISLNYCPITFPPDMDIGNGSVFVKIEICSFSQRHPEVYAASATNEDPASRLAFHVRYRDSNETEHQFYAKARSRVPIYRANTFVDILANNVTDEVIAKTPRRYLNFKKGRSPPGLKRFEGGDYTEL